MSGRTTAGASARSILVPAGIRAVVPVMLLVWTFLGGSFVGGAAAADEPAFPGAAPLDRAQAVLFDPGTRGEDLEVLLGRPEAGVRRTVSGRAEEARGLLARAEALLGAHLRQLESRPDFATDIELQERWRDLERIQLERRLPLLRGLALVLEASADPPGPATDRSWDEAARVLEPLIDRLDGRPRALAVAHLVLARAGLARSGIGTAPGDGPPGAGGDLGDERLAIALRTAIEVTEGPDRFLLEAAAARLLVARGRLDRAAGAIGSLVRRPDFNTSPFHRLLLADLELERRLAVAPDDEPGTVGSIAHAILSELLAEPWTGRIRGLESAVRQRLDRSYGPAVAAERLPTLALLGRADRLAAEQRAGEAAALLEDAVANRDGVDRVDLSMALAGHLVRLGRESEALDLLLPIIEDPDFPGSGGPILERARSLARNEVERAPAGPARRAAIDRAMRVLERACELGAAGRIDGPGAPWPEHLARFLLSTSPADGPIDDDAFARAVRWLKMLPGEPATDREADRGTDRGAERWILELQWRRMRAETEPPRRRLLAEDVLALVDAAGGVPAPGTPVGPDDGRRRLAYAEAHLALDHRSRAMERAEAVDAAGIDGPDLAALIRLDLALGRPDLAARHARAALARDPGSAAAALAGPMIEIAAAELDREARGEFEPPGETATVLLVPVLEAMGAAEGGSALARARAEALRLAGRSEAAAAAFQTLLAGAPDRADLLLGRAESLWGIGTEAALTEAMAIYNRLEAGTRPAVSGGGGGDGTGDGGGDREDLARIFWVSSLRRLQVLERVDRHTERIAPTIRRLRLVDPGLGGPALRPAFLRLERAFGDG